MRLPVFLLLSLIRKPVSNGLKRDIVIVTSVCRKLDELSSSRP
jgi:hypothetical protein